MLKNKLKSFDSGLANRVNSRWFLAGAFAEKYFQCISILASVLFVLSREALVV